MTRDLNSDNLIANKAEKGGDEATSEKRNYKLIALQAFKIPFKLGTKGNGGKVLIHHAHFRCVGSKTESPDPWDSR